MRNKSKLLVIVGSTLLVLVMALMPFMAACAPEEVAPPPEEEVTPPPEEEAPAFPESFAVGSGPVGGGYNMLIMGIAKYWEQDLGVAATVAPGVARQNLMRFQAGRLDVMISPSTWCYAAWTAMEEYGFTVPIRDIRVLLYIYPNPYYIIALKDSGMTKITDLKGKRVGCGPSAATWDKMLGDKLEANGIKYFGDDPDIDKTFASVADMCEMLGDGILDAATVMFEGLVPQPATTKLMEEKELVALEWDPAAVRQFEGTVFPPTLIKKELLPFLEEDHVCFEGGIGSIVVRADVDEDFVYALTKVAYERLEELAEENPFWRYPALYPWILTADFGIPYHPGAIKYWKEVGVWTVPGVE